MSHITLPRGDGATLTISGLKAPDENGVLQPAVFNLNDILRWTAKAKTADADVDALIAKSSTVAPGGITIGVGTDSAKVAILPADFDAITAARDLIFIWDLQLAIGGDATQIVTLCLGRGTISADVTLTAP